MILNEAQLTLYNFNKLIELNESILNKETPNEYNLISIFSKNTAKFQDLTKTYKDVIGKIESNLKETGVDVEQYNTSVDIIFNKNESKIAKAIKDKDNNKLKEIFKRSSKEITKLDRQALNPKLVIAVPYASIKIALKIIGLFKFFIKFLLKIVFMLIRPFEKFKKVLIPVAIGMVAIFLYPALLRLQEIFNSEHPKFEMFKTLLTFDLSEYLIKVQESGAFVFIKDIIMSVFNFLDENFGDIVESILDILQSLI